MKSFVLNAWIQDHMGRKIDDCDAAPERLRVALLIGLPLLLVVIGCDRTATVSSTNADLTTPANPMMVQVMELGVPQSFSENVIVFGQLTPARVNRLSFPDAGRIGTIAVTPGQQVAVDAPLAQLDVSQLQAQRRRQESAVNKYRNDLGSSARTPTQSSLNQLQNLESQLEQTDQLINRSVLRAPYAGRIGAIYVRAGQPVSAETAVLELEDLSRPALLAKLTRRIASQLDSAIITAKVGDQVFPVEGSSVNDLGETDVMLTPLQFSGDRYPNDWRVGEVSRLTFQIADGFPGHRLPISSLVQGHRGQWSIYVAIADSEPDRFVIEQRNLDQVRYRGSDVIVGGDLSRGDAVVVGGTQRIVPGQRVVSVLTNGQFDARLGQESPSETGDNFDP